MAGRIVGASRAFSVRQVMTVRNGKTAAETDHSRGKARQRDFITSRSSIMAGFYEPRATNNEPRLFPRTQMRRSAATDSGLYYDHVPLVINSGYTQNSRGTPATAVRSGSRPAPPDSRYLADQKGSGRPLRYRIQAMGEKEVTDCKKNTRPTALCVGDA